MNHFAVYLKLIQHCKSTILQFKKCLPQRWLVGHCPSPGGINGVLVSKAHVPCIKPIMFTLEMRSRTCLMLFLA